jgi:hypothetical protein
VEKSLRDGFAKKETPLSRAIFEISAELCEIRSLPREGFGNRIEIQII